jgi:hypothetical protein
LFKILIKKETIKTINGEIMKKKTKILKRILILLSIVVVFLLILTTILFIFVIKRPTKISDFSKTELNKWNKITLDSSVKSGDGSEYYLLTKKGTSNKWIIFFSGGGMNWDEASTASPITISSMLQGEPLTYFTNVPFYQLSTMGGILEADNKNNPFNDWNFIYIPYSTGDFHIGNNAVTYEKNNKTHSSYHNGKSNVLACLNWFFNNVAQPDKIFICGESAGGFGAAFWTPYIAEHETNTQIFEYSDSSYITTDKWADIVDSYWNADFKHTFGYEPKADIIATALSYDAVFYPNITFLQSNTLYDNLLINFQKRLNGVQADDSEYKDIWSEQMLNAAKKLAYNYKNYKYFITNYSLDAKKGTTPHTLSVADSFYDAKEEDISLCDWLFNSVENGLQKCIGSEFIR